MTDHEQMLTAVLSQTRKALFMCAASCQGGHSDAGMAASEALGVPFPISMDNLEAKAISEGLRPAELWPWLMRQRNRISYSSAAGD